VEFKKGIQGVEEDVKGAGNSNDKSYSSRPLPPEERAELTAPKFEPPESAPKAT
jgi:hypothetical protein